MSDTDKNTEATKVVHTRLSENYPDSCPSAWMVERIISEYFNVVEEKIIAGEEVSVYGHGKFKLVQRPNDNPNVESSIQYYPKFKFSRHAILRIREPLNSLSIADKKEIERKKTYIAKLRNKPR